MILNAIRTHCAEFGIIAAQGARKVSELVISLRIDDTHAVPQIGACALLSFASQLDSLEQEVRRIERQLLAWPSPIRLRAPPGHCSRKEKATRPHLRFERSRYNRRLISPQPNARAEVGDDD